MNAQTLFNALLIVVLVCWLGLRQVNWRPVEPARLWRMPIILGAVGVATFANGSEVSRLTGFDLGVIVFEVAVSVAIGALMGAMATFRPITDAGRARARDAAATLESRTGWWGFALWVGFIALRVGIDIGAGALGSQIASSTALILVLLAANRAARSAVLTARIGRLQPVAA